MAHRADIAQGCGRFLFKPYGGGGSAAPVTSAARVGSRDCEERFRQNSHPASRGLVSGKLEQFHAYGAPEKVVQTEWRGRRRQSAPAVSACLYCDLLERLVEIEIADRT